MSGGTPTAFPSTRMSKAVADPERFERVVSAAHLVTLGMTQKAAAEAVGVTPRTVTRWKADTDLWRAALDEAHGRWLAGVKQKAKQRLAEKLDSPDASDELVLTVLEKLVAEFAEGAQEHHVAVVGRVVHEEADPREILAAELDRIAERRALPLPGEGWKDEDTEHERTEK